MNKLTCNISHITNPVSVSVSDNHTSPTATAQIVCEGANVGVGDSISIELGYDNFNTKVFQGYVKNVEAGTPPQLVSVTASNILIRAVDYFIVSSDPDAPYSWSNIAAETLVGNVLDLAGITNYQGQASHFSFGINNPVEVNLVSAYDFAKQIADILAFSVYADVNGKTYFSDRKPFPMGGDSPAATLDNSNISNLKYSVSDRDLRNRVVVYGADGVYAEASAPSPFLPNGFYKSVAVVASFIDSNTYAQQAANYNLAALNRPTLNCSVTTIGNPNINCRNTVYLDKDDVEGVEGEWYVYSSEHNWSKDGYLTNLQLRK